MSNSGDKRLILIYFWLLYISNPRVHLQEDDCVYSYDMVRFTCFSISSLVDRKVRSEPTNVPYHTRMLYNRLPEDEPSVSKHMEDIKNNKKKY
jgi:hypothetical protein